MPPEIYIWLIVIATLGLGCGIFAPSRSQTIKAIDYPDTEAAQAGVEFASRWLTEQFLIESSAERAAVLDGARRMGRSIQVPSRISPNHKIKITPGGLKQVDPVGAYGQFIHVIEITESQSGLTRFLETTQEFRLAFEAIPRFFDDVTVFWEDGGTGSPGYALAARVEGGTPQQADLMRSPGEGGVRGLQLLLALLDHKRLEPRVRFRLSQPQDELAPLLSSGNARSGLITFAAGENPVILDRVRVDGPAVILTDSALDLRDIELADAGAALWIVSRAAVTLSGAVHLTLVTSGPLRTKGSNTPGAVVGEARARLVGGLILRGGFRPLPDGLVVEHPLDRAPIRWVQPGKARPSGGLLGIEVSPPSGARITAVTRLPDSIPPGSSDSRSPLPQISPSGSGPVPENR